MKTEENVQIISKPSKHELAQRNFVLWALEWNCEICPIVIECIKNQISTENMCGVQYHCLSLKGF